MTVYITLEDITPELAKKYLQTNYEKNRKVRQQFVNQYAHDMKHGRWDIAYSDDIVISDTGKVLNGQHRLYACIQSGCSFKNYVKHGVPEESYKVMDIGVVRTVVDLVDTRNAANKSTLAKYVCATKLGGKGSGIGNALIGRLYHFKENGKSTFVPVTKPMQVEEINTNGEELNYCVNQGERLWGVFKKWGISTYAYFVWLVRWTGHDDCLEEFIDTVCNLGSGNATVNVVRNKLLQKAAEKNVKTKHTYVVCALLYAYEAYVNGKTIKSLTQCEKVQETWNMYIDEMRKSV